MSVSNHPNIVHIYGGCMTPPNRFVVEELLLGDLTDLIHKRGTGQKLAMDRVLAIALDVIHGLVSLEECVWVHG